MCAKECLCETKAVSLCCQQVLLFLYYMFIAVKVMRTFLPCDHDAVCCYLCVCCAALSKVSVGETTAGSHASELTSPPQGMAQNSSNPLPPLSTSQRDITLQSSQLRSNSSSSLPANMPVCTAATTGTASASSDRVMASGDNRSSKVS